MIDKIKCIYNNWLDLYIINRLVRNNHPNQTLMSGFNRAVTNHSLHEQLLVRRKQCCLFLITSWYMTINHSKILNSKLIDAMQPNTHLRTPLHILSHMLFICLLLCQSFGCKQAILMKVNNRHGKNIYQIDKNKR